jgi:hypothetical protein
MKVRFPVLLLLAFTGTAAHAQEDIYVGLGFGNFTYEEATGDIFLGDVEDTNTRWKLFGGFEFNDNFALEIQYGETSDLSDTRTQFLLLDGDDVPDEVTGKLTTDFTITALNAVGQWPFEWGALLGGIGYFTSDSDFTATANAPCCGSLSRSGSIRDNGLSAMLGLEFRFGRFGTRYGIRLEYEWWDMDGIDTSAIGLGLTYGF